MALTGNKGEWSEIYALFKLLGEKQVFAGDGNLNKIENLFYPILCVLRNEQGHNYEYNIEDEIVIVTEDGIELLRKSVDDFLFQSHELLSIIRSSNGTFSSPETERFMYNRQNELYIFSKRTIHFSEKKACYVLCEKEQMKSSYALFFNRVSSAFSQKARNANLKRELHDV